MFAPFCCLTVKCGRGPLLSLPRSRSLPLSIDSDNNEQVNCFRVGGFARKSHQLITRAPNCVVTDRNCTGGKASVLQRLCCSCLNNVGCLPYLHFLSSFLWIQSQVGHVLFPSKLTKHKYLQRFKRDPASTASKHSGIPHGLSPRLETLWCAIHFIVHANSPEWH